MRCIAVARARGGPAVTASIGAFTAHTAISLPRSNPLLPSPQKPADGELDNNSGAAADPAPPPRTGCLPFAWPAAWRRRRAPRGRSRAPPAKAPPLSPVSRIYLGMGDRSPDIYAVVRLRGCASLDDISKVMEALTAAHERFRMRIARRADGKWAAEVREGGRERERERERERGRERERERDDRRAL